MSEAESGERSRPATWLRLLVCAALVIAVFALYRGVLAYGFVDLDDADYVTNNSHVKRGLTLAGVRWALTTGYAANWHPLTWLSHMLDVELYGLAPLGHHATSIALHAANSVLALLVLERLTRSFWRSAAVAALFALHPLRVESVAWVAERKDVLCAFFFFVMLLAYARYVERPSAGRYCAVAVALALGLLAKPMIVTAPFLLLVLDVWPLRRLQRADSSANTLRGLLLEKLPLVALAAASSIATFVAQRTGGAVAPVEAVSIPVRFLNAVISYGRYLQQTFWPAGLCAYYPYPRSSQLVPLILSVIVLSVITWFALRRRAQRPYLLFGWLWFLGTLVPVIGLVQVGAQAHADRYTYLPSIGVFVALVWWVADGLERARAPRWAGPSLALATLVPCAWLTQWQTRFWRDSQVLLERALAVTHENALARQWLGGVLIERGHMDEALVHLREALRLSPTFSFAYNSLGAAVFTQGHLEESEKLLRRAVELDGKYSAPPYNLGLTLEKQGRFGEALASYERSLELNPSHAPAHAHAASSLRGLGRHEEALAHYRAALELEPDDVGLHRALAETLGSLGRLEGAASEYRAALALAPNEVELHRYYAITLTLLGRVEEAIAEYEALLRVRPSDADALNNIAWIRATHEQAEHRNAAKAIECAERARDLLAATPNEVVFDTLAAAYAEAGRFDDALAACGRAIELATQAGDDGAAERFRSHLELFKSRQPLRGK